MESHTPWTREDRWALGVLLLGCVAGFVLLVHPWHSFMNDGSIYLSTTRSMLRGEGYSYLGQAFHLRPIGFPLLLAPVMAGVGADPAVLNPYVALFGVASLVLLYLLIRPWLGGVLALAATAVVGTNPIFLKLSSEVMSDVPGLCFLLVALLLARRAQPGAGWAREVALGLAIAWAAHVRMLAIFLLPAVLIARWIGWSREPAGDFAGFLRTRCLAVVAACLIGFAPWVVRNAVTANPPPADQLLNYSYATALFHYDFGNPASARVSLEDWLERLGERGRQITAGLASRLQTDEIAFHHVIVTSLIVAAVLYSAVALPSPAVFFLLFALAMTGSYFAYQDRLLLPIFALALPVFLRVSTLQLERFASRAVATGVGVVLCLGLIAADFEPRRGWDAIEARHRQMQANRDLLLREIPADRPLATVRGFHYHMLLDRPVYSLRWAHRLGAGKAGVDALIERHGIDVLFFDPEVPLDERQRPAFEADYGPARRLGDLYLIELDD